MYAALGPCGHATCPYGSNFGSNACKQICNQSPTLTNNSYASCIEPPCNLEGCPYAQDPKKKRYALLPMLIEINRNLIFNRYPAGCGNPKCAYTKYKLGLVDQDAELELQFLPPAVTGTLKPSSCQISKKKTKFR